MPNDSWIWLPAEMYPTRQKTVFNALYFHDTSTYTVCECVRRYALRSIPRSVHLRFSGDTLFQLYLNNRCIATGPASVGGDFLHNETVRDHYYAYEMELTPQSDMLDFLARVQMTPDRLCDYSMGHGGFMLTATVTYPDGTTEIFQTDESWRIRLCGAYKAPRQFDGSILPEAFVQAERTPDIWHAETAPIPPREEHETLPEEHEITLQPHEERTVELPFSRILAGFLHVQAKCAGNISITAELLETDRGATETLLFSASGEYRGFFLHSVSRIRAQLKNDSDAPARVSISLILTHYPVTEEAHTVTDDDDLNLILDVCQHTLKICRQTHHLDSPSHCEPLACTGDYYIESLMTQFSFGDMRLAAFDLQRTATMLEREDGRMFHTTYSLIFVRMLYDTYMATGELTLLRDCEHALHLLLTRFETYLGENGLIENPPDYMFIDWIYIDGITMHHPPKALGQSCLNMFYYGALCAAERIFAALDRDADAQGCRAAAKTLRQAIQTQLFDAERGMYFEGLNTPTDEAQLNMWLPQNTEKRYYLKHANILAAAFDVCDDTTGKSLIHRIMADEIPGDCQPYFLHFLFEAIERLDLRDEYTISLVRRWTKPIRECPLGLVEGFVKPEPTYQFDHSHAWGGTPLYSLPRALMGVEILAPGMHRLRLRPSLLGLNEATATLLTPLGAVTCRQKKGFTPQITAPDGVEIEIL